MTVVIVLSDCPPKLRGDMTKWFIEINTGVYVGNLSARVRDEVWGRIEENIGKGHATMVFGAAGEQHMDFRVHNAYWEPVDFEGIKLMRRPNGLIAGKGENIQKPGYSNATKRRIEGKQKTYKKDPVAQYRAADYVVLDLETTGLNDQQDEIIEIGAILVERGQITEKFQVLVQCEKPLTAEITQLTGITLEELQSSGISLSEAIQKLCEFAEDLPFVCYSAKFEQSFLTSACQRLDLDPFENRMIDALEMTRLLLPGLVSYKLASVADMLSVPNPVSHRALPDCETTYGIYVKLNEIKSETYE